jgi:uncharacterized membrane protein YedE/YeeE
MTIVDSLSIGPSLLGGALIGLAASLVLLGQGRVAGISGMYGGLFDPHQREHAYRGWFVSGLVLSGLLVRIVAPEAFEAATATGLGRVALAGVLVGFGTRLGNGCTSGHGVCGLSRLSPRSLVATTTFMAAGMFAVFLARHVVGEMR